MTIESLKSALYYSSVEAALVAISKGHLPLQGEGDGVLRASRVNVTDIAAFINEQYTDALNEKLLTRRWRVMK